MRAPDVIPSTVERIPRQTDKETMKRSTANSGQCRLLCNARSRLLDIRLQELDREWDIERLLEANAATVSLVGLRLTRFVSRRWLPAADGRAGFLLQQCPAGLVSTRLAFRRIQREIDEERYALEVLRGDFTGMDGNGRPTPQAVLQAVRA
jgi:hypothetical protein